MTPVADLSLATTPIRRERAAKFTSADDATLREALKRCSPATYQAALRYRQTGDTSQLPAIVLGVIERYIERDLRPKLRHPASDLLLADDLGIDSLTMMEIVMLAEDVLQITITSEELVGLRTLADAQRFIAAKARGELAPTPSDPGAANRRPAISAISAGVGSCPTAPVRLSSNR
jgi:3-hydroxyacyl-[acyl-carrier-protein] dehydratase